MPEETGEAPWMDRPIHSSEKAILVVLFTACIWWWWSGEGLVPAEFLAGYTLVRSYDITSSRWRSASKAVIASILVLNEVKIIEAVLISFLALQVMEQGDRIDKLE